MNKITVFLLVFIISVGLYSQTTLPVNYIAEYSLIYQRDSTDVDSKKSEIMLLKIGDNFSQFISRNLYLKDSLINVTKEKGNAMYLLANLNKIPKSNFSEIIYKDYSQKEIKFQDKVLKDIYVYKESLGNLSWKIENDFQTISDYKCQKATLDYRGRKWIAWFTTEIPIPDGPYKFNNLPGLIIKMTDSKNHFDYTLQSFYKVENQSIDINNENYTEVTAKELFAVKKDFKENGIERLADVGIKIELNDKQRNELKKKTEKNNNPIELTFK